MQSRRVTNWLLLGIFAALAGHLLLRLGPAPAVAETLRLDTCITSEPNDRPNSYLHVVTHNFAGD